MYIYTSSLDVNKYIYVKTIGGILQDLFVGYFQAHTYEVNVCERERKKLELGYTFFLSLSSLFFIYTI